MRKKLILGIFIFPFFFLGCKSQPIKIQTNEFSAQTIKIYFPEFYHDDGTVIEGDGIIITLPDGKTIIIDGFKPEAAPQYVDFINSLGISKIDYLIASHYHSDHIGTFSTLINTFDIGEFISNGAPADNKAARQLLSTLSEKNIKQKTLRARDKFFFDENCYIDVLWPELTENEIYDIYYNPGKTAALINLSSLVFKFHYNDFTVLFTGDIYKKGETALSRQFGKELKADILKAPHHGDCYTANTYRFIKKISPDYTVIQDNRYIRKLTAAIYKIAGSNLLYKLTPGYILIESDGYDYEISDVSF